MQVWQSIDSLGSIKGPIVIALGTFDGLHLGHKAVIAAAKALATELRGTAVVGTFSPHPRRVLLPEASTLTLTSLPHKKRLLAKMDVSHMLVVPFTQQFASQDPSEFLNALNNAANPLGGIVTGSDFCFGKHRSGNVAMMADFGAAHNIKVIAIPAVMLDGERISSTRLRHAVKTGDFATADRLLGRPHTVLGTVIEGKKLGRTLGFPTANLHVHSEQLPPLGVYAVTLEIDDTTHTGVANLGFRPTTDNDSAPVLEVHIFDFNREIYGQDIAVRFNRFLRPEKKFDNLDALKEQIALDIATAKT